MEGLKNGRIEELKVTFFLPHGEGREGLWTGALIGKIEQYLKCKVFLICSKSYQITV